MRKALGLVVLATLVLGCFASKPPQNVGFARLNTIHDLQGSYENRGEGASDKFGAHYLSTVIWPGTNAGVGRSDIDHASIVTIVVEAVGDTALFVRALRSDGVEKEQTFVQGRDFQFQSGRLVLRHGFGSTVGPDSPLLGTSNTSVELGLDEKGQGKYKMTESAAGLAYLFIPVAGRQTWEVRFIRRDQ